MGKVIYIMPGQCSVCGEPAKIRGYCRADYQRLRKAGELAMNYKGLTSRGRRQDHPLYQRWCAMRKTGVCESWADFWVFADAVGDGGGCSKMLRLDQSAPFGPDNFRWADKLVGERKNAYYRNWYKTGRKGRDGRYRKAYGIGLDEYEAISAAQEGLCALCKTSGNAKKLAVDHDHATGAVRGLLCQDCNTALGLLKDDAALLFAAIQYLGRFKSIGKVS